MTDAITGCTKMLTSAGFGEVKLRRSESRLTPGLAIQTDQGARTFTFLLGAGGSFACWRLGAAAY